MTRHPDIHVPAGVGEMLLHSLERFADAPAVVDVNRSVSYAGLARDIAHAITALNECGARPGDRIVQISRNRYESVVLVAACYIGGFISVPLLYSSEVEEHAFAVGDSEPSVLVIEEAFMPRVEALARACGRRFHVLTHETLSDRFRAPAPAPLASLAPEVDGHDCARMVYTGGTTGRPKGVMNSASALAFAAMLLASAHEFDARTAFLLCAPISHGAGSFIVPVLSRGGRLLVHRSFELDAVIDAFCAGDANSTLMVPTMLYALLDHPRCHAIPAGAVRRLVYGAAPMSPARLQEAVQRFGCVLAQSYGQTEVPSAITWLAPQEHLREPKLLASAGRPYPGVKVRLVAAGKVLARRSREVGEICVQAPHVMLGYWRQPELTAQATAEGWLHTGDLAYEDEAGYLYIVDRAKDLIISGGFNIYPSEVEALIDTHPAVRSSALIGVPHEKWGEAAHAFVVLADGALLSEGELQEFVRGRLGPVKTPKSVHFITKLPLTKVGKVDKKALRAPFWADSARAVN